MLVANFRLKSTGVVLSLLLLPVVAPVLHQNAAPAVKPAPADAASNPFDFPGVLQRASAGARGVAAQRTHDFMFKDFFNFTDESSLAAVLKTLLVSGSSVDDNVGVSKNCTMALRYITTNPIALFYMIDAFGKPRSGVSQGALAWPGSYDLCVDTLKMRHCMMPFNTTKFPKTPEFASYATPGAIGKIPSFLSVV